MKEKSKHLKPYVTLEQAFTYDEQNPETRTPSPLVDAVMEAFHTLRPLSAKKVGEYLGLPSTKISTALEIATGYNLTDFREQWAIYKIRQLKSENPEASMEAIAHAVGFANRSALWKVFHRDKRKQEYAKQKKNFELYSSLSREEQDAQFEELIRQSKAHRDKLREL